MFVFTLTNQGPVVDVEAEAPVLAGSYKYIHERGVRECFILIAILPFILDISGRVISYTIIHKSIITITLSNVRFITMDEWTMVHWMEWWDDR